MMAFVWRATLLSVTVAIMLSWGCGKPRRPASPTQYAGGVTIRGRTWQVELADTAELRYRGLSDRRELPEGAGMLFVYPAPQPMTFCMRKCLIPLDIAFIGSDLRVVNMCTMEVEPYGLDTRTYHSSAPAQFALEVPRGALAAAGVQVGDRVEFSSDIPPAAKAEPGP